jgi:hypothetical protein
MVAIGEVVAAVAEKAAEVGESEAVQGSAEVASQGIEQLSAEIGADAMQGLPEELHIAQQAENISISAPAAFEGKIKTFSTFDAMVEKLREIKGTKPPNSPNVSKWYQDGGKIAIDESMDKPVWKYIDAEGRAVEYINGYPEFPKEALHPDIGDIDIGKFTGDRELDKSLFKQQLFEQYGLTEIPAGYRVHHTAENGILQLVKADWHSKFTHQGGFSLYKGVA